MTEFMHYKIVLERLWQKEYLVIEVEILFCRATTPSAPGVANRYLVIQEAIVHVPHYKLLLHQVTRVLFMYTIVLV
jgi:hypothetical protein